MPEKMHKQDFYNEPSAGTMVLWLSFSLAALSAAGIEKFRCYPGTCVGSNPMLTLHCGREAKCSSSGGGRLLVAVESLSDLVYIRFDS